MKSWCSQFVAGECWKLSSAQATYTTFAGPTGVATNMGALTTLHKTQFNSKFKRP